MDSQFYTAASGMIVQEKRLELIANNLANLNTPGYRPQHAFSAVFQRFGEQASEIVRTANAGVALAGTYEEPGPGPLRATGQPLDLALGAEEFLAVETSGGRRYIRAGNLQISADGTLVDSSGHRLLNPEGKPIQGLSPSAVVTATGKIEDAGTNRGNLLIVRDTLNVLRREGNNLSTADGRDGDLETVAEPAVRPGWLETSGTNVVLELIRLIEAQRAFQSYQKIISTSMNEVDRKAVNDLIR
jgi:flagellar basal-body rod protein FlgG